MSIIYVDTTIPFVVLTRNDEAVSEL